MILDIRLPDNAKLSPRTTIDYRDFLQHTANRIVVGEIRYGSPNRMKRYLSRLEKELGAYRRTGNIEHLYNIANYAFLESVAPEHKKQNFDPTVKSATRSRKEN